jgi:DNA-binding NarL/FixJ family response regulator
MVISGFLAGQKQDDADQISTRKREILQLLAEGYSNKEVAETLNLSLNTVETHRFNVMRKLGVYNIVDLVLYAIRNHIIEV